MAIRGDQLVQERPGVSLRASFDRLQEFTALEPNWDSYGALPPTGQSIWTAGRLLVAVTDALGDVAENQALPWAIAPFSEGIQIEWRGRRDALEIHVDGEGRLGFLRERHEATGLVYDEGDDIGLAAALDHLRDMFGT